MTTRISVVIPCFNAEPFLRQAVESLRATQYPNLEIIIFDDGSTDGSRALAADLASEGPDIHLYAHDGHANLGPGRTRNAAVRFSSGEYLAFLDADDYVFPCRFSGPSRILDGDPDIDAVCGTTERRIDPGGEDRGTRIRPQTVFDCTDPDRVLEYRLFRGLAWSTNAILLRRAAFDRAGGFSERRTGEDAVLWLKLACVARIASAGPDPIAIYRICPWDNWDEYLKRPFEPHNSLVVSEALAWARKNGVRKEYLNLLLRALEARTLLDNRRLREDLRFSAAFRHLGRQMLDHPSLSLRGGIWRGITCTMLEGLRMRKPAFEKTDE